MSYAKLYDQKEAIEFLRRLEAGEVSDEECMAVQTIIISDESYSRLPESIDKLGKLQILDLSSTGINELPESIGKLRELQYLNLGYAGIVKLPESIGELSELQTLWLNHTRINELPESIGKLGKLQKLSLSYTGVSELPESICELHDLQYLDLGYTGINKLPESISKLKKLRNLDLSSTGITELPESICELQKLRQLDLRDTQLIGLPPKFVLNWLNLGGQFSDSFSPVHDKKYTYLFDTTLRDQPIGLFLSNDEAAIRAYCEEALRRKEEKRLSKRGRIVFLGKGQAGKTHTIQRLLQDEKYRKGEIKEKKAIEPTETQGVTIEAWNPNQTDYHFDIWDFGGQEILYSLHRCFLSDGCLYVVMIRERENDATEEAMKWLDTIERYAKNSKVILAVNVEKPESGVPSLEHQLPVPSLREKYPSLLQDAPVLAFCAAENEGDGFEDFCAQLLEQAKTLESVQRQLSTGEMSVMQRLRAYQGELLPFAEYQTWCREADIGEGVQETYARWLAALGLCFRYRDTEEYQLLEPNWITTAAYTIIRRIQQQPKRKPGIDAEHHGNDHGAISHSDLLTILREAGVSGFDGKKIRYILQVLRQHRLSFPLGDDTEFFPALCPEDDKGAMRESVKGWEKKIVMELSFPHLRDDDFFTMMVAAENDSDMTLDRPFCFRRAFRVHTAGLCATVEYLSKSEPVRLSVYARGDSSRPYVLLREVRRVLIGALYAPKYEHIIKEERVGNQNVKVKLSFEECISDYSEKRKEITYFDEETHKKFSYNIADILGMLYSPEEMEDVASLAKVPDTPVKVPDTPVKVPDTPVMEMLKSIFDMGKEIIDKEKEIIDNQKQQEANEKLIRSLVDCLGGRMDGFMQDTLRELEAIDRGLADSLRNKEGGAFLSGLKDIFHNTVAGVAATGILAVAETYGGEVIKNLQALLS